MTTVEMDEQKQSQEQQEKLDKKVETLNAQWTGLRRVPRREVLIAQFVDGFAAGWKFRVHVCLKDALDIKLSTITINKKTYQTWTQGHAFNFKEQTAIYSHDHSNWSEFLKRDDAVCLKVMYATPAGFENAEVMIGEFNGGFITGAGVLKPTPVENMDVELARQRYDSGTLTVDILRPNTEKNAIEVVDTISISQVEFVALLQTGYYWTKPETGADEHPRKVVLVK